MSTCPPNSNAPDSNSGSSAGAAFGAATGAATGFGLWDLAASMMSAAAIVNGGGVASGSAVAIMQSIGAVGLATPVGLGLVASGAAVGGAMFLVKSRLSRSGPNDREDEDRDDGDDKEKDRWVLVEISPDSGEIQLGYFDNDCKARKAFTNSLSTCKALFDPEQKIVLELGWDSVV